VRGQSPRRPPSPNSLDLQLLLLHRQILLELADLLQPLLLTLGEGIVVLERIARELLVLLAITINRA